MLVRVDGSAPPIRLSRPLTIVGSKLQSHLRIVSATISGSHALLLNLGNNVLLRDLMSRSHVYVNDREVAECRLKYGDVVRFGEMRFRFIDQDVLRESLEKLRSPPSALDREGREPVPVGSPLFVIGRLQGANLMLDDEEVSKAHAVLFEHDGQRVLRDLGSRRGTIVEGQRVRAVTLRGGELIRIGRTVLRYRAGSLATENAAERISDTSIDRMEATDVASAEGQGLELATDPASSDGAPADSHVFVEEAVVIDSPSDLQPAEDHDLDPALVSPPLAAEPVGLPADVQGPKTHDAGLAPVDAPPEQVEFANAEAGEGNPAQLLDEPAEQWLPPTADALPERRVENNADAAESVTPSLSAGARQQPNGQSNRPAAVARESRQKGQEPRPAGTPTGAALDSKNKRAASPLSDILGDGLLTMSTTDGSAEPQPPEQAPKHPPVSRLLIVATVVFVIGFAAFSVWYFVLRR